MLSKLQELKLKLSAINFEVDDLLYLGNDADDTYISSVHTNVTKLADDALDIIEDLITEVLENG